jgi:hypothetical protein
MNGEGFAFFYWSTYVQYHRGDALTLSLCETCLEQWRRGKR